MNGAGTAPTLPAPDALSLKLSRISAATKDRAMPEGIITLRKGREKPVIQQHPWIFSGAIDAQRGNPRPGDFVTVITHDGDFLARGYWNPRSQIQVRILTWRDESITYDWWRNALLRAISARLGESLRPYTCRLVNAENDFIPGLIVDAYTHEDGRLWLVLQALTLGIELHKNEIAAALGDILGPAGIYERSDVDVRHKEGLDQTRGILVGAEPPDHIITANADGLRLLVDVRAGHKTGLYLDQFANHRILKELVADLKSPSVLNLFSYTGIFGLSALQGGAAHIIQVDSSRDALETAAAHIGLNDLSHASCAHIQADVFKYLHDIARQPDQHDIVILDPPKFAHTKSQVDKAARGYKDINLNAFRVIRPGGYLLTFSCSGAVDSDLFQKIVFGALADSRRQAQIIRRLGPGPDHPIALTFPEGDYLKGLLLRVY